jgi:hypothetical protein
MRRREQAHRKFIRVLLRLIHEFDFGSWQKVFLDDAFAPVRFRSLICDGKKQSIPGNAYVWHIGCGTGDKRVGPRVDRCPADKELGTSGAFQASTLERSTI